MTIYIVIDGIGSFLLSGGFEGEYSLTIASSNFESETEYSYHFSNQSGGSDLAPGYGGTVLTSEEEEEEKDSYLIPILLLVIAFLLICAGIFVIIVAVRKTGEEAEDWDEE
jgi:hypothetical protein